MWAHQSQDIVETSITDSHDLCLITVFISTNSTEEQGFYLWIRCWRKNSRKPKSKACKKLRSTQWQTFKMRSMLRATRFSIGWTCSNSSNKTTMIYCKMITSIRTTMQIIFIASKHINSNSLPLIALYGNFQVVEDQPQHVLHSNQLSRKTTIFR